MNLHLKILISKKYFITTNMNKRRFFVFFMYTFVMYTCILSICTTQLLTLNPQNQKRSKKRNFPGARILVATLVASRY